MDALEAIAAGVGLLVIVPDRVPIWDVLAIAEAAKVSGARFVGPAFPAAVSLFDRRQQLFPPGYRPKEVPVAVRLFLLEDAAGAAPHVRGPVRSEHLLFDGRRV